MVVQGQPDELWTMLLLGAIVGLGLLYSLRKEVYNWWKYRR